MSDNGASTILAWSFRLSMSCIIPSIQRGVISRLWMYKGERHARSPIPEMRVNGASLISGLASWITSGLCDSVEPWSQYWPPLWAKRRATISLPPPKDEPQQSVNDFWFCISDNSRTVQRHTPIITIMAAFIDQHASHDIATTSWKWVSMERQWFLVL